MTLLQLSNHLHSLSVGGYFNHKKFTRQELAHYLRHNASDKKHYIMEIAMMDGWWYFFITQYSPGEFDYTIPDCREHEEEIKRKLVSGEYDGKEEIV